MCFCLLVNSPIRLIKKMTKIQYPESNIIINPRDRKTTNAEKKSEIACIKRALRSALERRARVEYIILYPS